MSLAVATRKTGSRCSCIHVKSVANIRLLRPPSVLWLAAKELFGYYIGHIATLKHIYGIYTFLIIAAFWMYYSAFVLIVAAEIGQLYSERRDSGSLLR